MLRFPTPAVSFASEPVVFGFEAFDSETLVAPSLISAVGVLPFASLAAFAARFSFRLRFLSCSHINRGVQRCLRSCYLTASVSCQAHTGLKLSKKPTSSNKFG